MAFIFTMRSAQPGPGHGHRPSTGTLPAISEDGADFNPPPIPQIPRRAPGYGQPTHPWSTVNFVRAFERSANRSPPSYSFQSSSIGEEDNEKGPNIREKKQIAKRGGWKRLAFIVLIVGLCLVGLIVGLVVGLRQRLRKSNSTSGSAVPAPVINTTFPAGSYGVQTFLDTMSTKCTSNSATWRCYPYSTYSESQTAAAAQFDWLIQPKSEGSSNYTISSTNNPFSLSFTNATLNLVDVGLSTERYTFQVDMNKAVVPVTDITGENISATCYFNSTTFKAELYTKMEKSYPSDNRTSDGNTTAFAPWPYAASMKQVAMSGTNVPECFTNDGKAVGSFSVMTNGDSCNCNYQNYSP